MPVLIQHRVTVSEGGVVRIQDDRLPAGATVTVEVATPVSHSAGDGATNAPDPSGLPSLTSLIGSGRGLFKTPEEVDAHIRELRDECD